MKTPIAIKSLLAALVVGIAGCRSGNAPALKHTLSVTPEIKKAFQSGDSIEIRSIIGTAPKFQTGGTYRVVGACGQHTLNNATLYLGNVPVFYFPYFRRSLRQHSNYWVIVPGYRSLDGPYLLTSYNWYWNERLGGALHIDVRAKRGVGVGPDLDWHLPRFGDGKAGYYYIHDVDPGEDAFGRPIDSDRQRAFLTHLAEPRTNLTARRQDHRVSAAGRPHINLLRK